MRPDAGFLGALRGPLAQNLRALRVFSLQNQLRLPWMANIEAGAVAPVAALARSRAPAWLLALVSLVTVAAAIALLAIAGAEPLVLGLLALLAVGGVFLVFGLLTGVLRFGRQGAGAEMVRTITDGLDSALQVVNAQGSVVYQNCALERITGRRAGGLMSLEEMFAGEPDSAQAFFRLNRAAERGETRDEEFYFRAGFAGTRDGRWLRVGVRAFKAQPAAAAAGRLTLWEIADITRARSREIETVSGLEATLAFYDGLPQGLFAVAADGRIAHLNATLAQWLGIRPDAPRTLTLLDILPADGAALVRTLGRAAPGRTVRLDVDLLREDGSAFPAQLICRGRGAGGAISVLVLERGADPVRLGGRAHSEIRLTRLFEQAPFGIATADETGRISTANTAFLRMFAVEGRGVPACIADLAPPADEQNGQALAKALQRAASGRTGASPIEVSFGPKGELARRVYVSPLGTGASAPQGAMLYAIDATEQKALELKFAQSHKMEAVGQLAGGVAHDFNNVLTAIIGFSDLLLQTHRPTDPAYRDIMNIKSSANRAAGPGAPAARVLAAPDAAAGSAGAGRCAQRPVRLPQPGARRENRAKDPARRATCGTSRPTRRSSST